MPHPDPAAEAAVIRFVESIEEELIAVLQRRTQMLDEAGQPRYSRHVAIHATVDLAGRLMLSAIATDGERGQTYCRGLVDHLQLLIAPTATRPS